MKLALHQATCYSSALHILNGEQLLALALGLMMYSQQKFRFVAKIQSSIVFHLLRLLLPRQEET